MGIISIILIIIGLCLFEVVSSIDNAVINAEVLSTMSEKAKNGSYYMEYYLRYL
ncbi:hypothetical protein [Clostridium ljungdahlii]|uniref:hypothetical protein n=1 Tax=Clostridium ljungdahlii TaxID=1538 RepID=UPI003865831D